MLSRGLNVQLWAWLMEGRVVSVGRDITEHLPAQPFGEEGAQG